jgi:hypothetical protein
VTGVDGIEAIETGCVVCQKTAPVAGDIKTGLVRLLKPTPL